MARGINKVILVGNVGKDIELKYTPGGLAIATTSLATSESWLDKQSGERKEETEWHRLVFFKRSAEIAGEYITKGSQLYVEGKIKTRSWDDAQTGAKRYSTEIHVKDFQMLGSRNETQPGNSQPASSSGFRKNPPPAQNPAPGKQGEQSTGYDDFKDDDIPF